MNVDVLADNPRWTTDFYIAGPVFAVVMMSVIFLKCLWKPLKDLTKDFKGPIKNFIYLTIDFLNAILKRFRRSGSKIPDEENQISPSTVDERYKQPFFDALRSKNAVITRHLLSAGVVDFKWVDGNMTGLQYAAASGDEGIVKQLLENGANVNVEPPRYKGRTALQGASQGSQ